MKTPLTDEFLQSLEGMSHAEPQPYFYTRLQARIQRSGEVFTAWKPSFAFALSLVLVMNIYFLKNNDRVQQPINPQQEFANGYQLNADFNY